MDRGLNIEKIEKVTSHENHILTLQTEKEIEELKKKKIFFEEEVGSEF